MADYQIGDNLYAEASGKYYNLQNGAKAYTKSPLDSMQEQVNSVYDNQKNSQLSQLKAQRDAAIGKINQQQGQTKQEFYDKRNQADVVNAQNVQRLREMMATNGVSMSGDNLTLNAKANSDRMNALNSLNNQEQSQMNNYNSQIADWNNPAKDQAITGQIDGERSKALMDVYNQAQQQMYQQYRDYQGQQLAKQQAAAQAAAEQAKAAASIQAAQIRAAQTSAKATQAAATATVKPKTAEQSYNDALAYWSNKKADVQQEGAYRVEQALRNDPAQIQALNDQGYDINKVIDALYSSASDGRFNSKNDFTNYYNGLVKQVQAGSR